MVFALRLLRHFLEQSVAARFQPLLDRVLSRTSVCVALGAAAAALLQAKSVLLVALMALVDSGLVTLTQGLLVMLGTTVGATTEAWMMTELMRLGPVVVGLATFTLLVANKALVRELTQIILAVGLALLGLEMMVENLEPLVTETHLLQWLGPSSEGLSPSQVVAAVLVGATSTVLLNSSASGLALVMALASQGFLSLPSAVALSLGVNLGTAFWPLFLSLGAERNGKRLVLAHALVVAGGTLGWLVAWPLTLKAVVLVSGGFGASPSASVALAYTGLNLVNSLAWCLWIRVLRQSLDGRVADPASPCPKEALERLEKLSQRIEQACLKDPSSRAKVGRVRLERKLEKLKADLYERLEGGDEATWRRTELVTQRARTCLTLDAHWERGLFEGTASPELLERLIEGWKRQEQAPDPPAEAPLASLCWYQEAVASLTSLDSIRERLQVSKEHDQDAPNPSS